MAWNVDPEQPPQHRPPARSRAAGSPTRHRRLDGGPRRCRRVGQRADDLDRVYAPLSLQPDGADRRRRLALVRERPGHAQDPCGVDRRRVGAERVRQAPVRALELIARQRSINGQ
jgi:hypothetical protein